MERLEQLQGKQKPAGEKPNAGGSQVRWAVIALGRSPELSGTAHQVGATAVRIGTGKFPAVERAAGPSEAPRGQPTSSSWLRAKKAGPNLEQAGPRTEYGAPSRPRLERQISNSSSGESR